MFSEQFEELCFYTLTHPDQIYFVHQHVVDAQTAQAADANTKPISIIYALIGLYLFVEKNYTGKQVQQAHMQLAKRKNKLPAISLPTGRGGITVEDVLQIPPSDQRDRFIKRWCASVWEAYNDVHTTIANYFADTMKG